MTDLPWHREVCPECQFDPMTFAPEALADEFDKIGKRYRAPLIRGLPGEDLTALLRTRPSPEVWSALEVACHVRDVLAVQDGRVRQVLTEDHPRFGWWDHDASVIEDHYNEQEPATVVEEVAANASRLAATLRSVPADAWERDGERRDGEVFTVTGLGRFTLHEASHHLLDVGRALRAARGR